ncbi:hypothetical protein [Metallosphaera hakonensis]|uniref:Uncharacterized protein n=1 Tax=Metallosphaera hakonensis JCM 8857 = DSM 7519 TaxID=1293036 RepID=A0A2U9ISN8_9CREN|nr:hypothetical protein [Metallosphaera hakonensis]AWR99038.1 hypothetical protein DFR87_04290 [Metallosphaera hakonensis JCM 8857 = DSM 7519]
MSPRILIVVMVVIIASSIASLTYVVISFHKTVYISTSSLDQELGGKWSVLVRGQIEDPNGISPIIAILLKGSIDNYYSSYYSTTTNLTVMVFKYNTSNLSDITQTIRNIYRILNWSVKNVSGGTNGFCIVSSNYQYLYLDYKDYLIVVVISGVIHPNESVQVARMQEQLLN